MQKLINFLRGSVRLEITGAFPERFINLCAQRGLGFWGVEWLGGGVLRITVTRRDLRRAEDIGEKALCHVERLTPRGVPFFLSRFRRRYAFMAGLALSLLAVSILSRYVLVIEVSGNTAVSSAVILSELWRQGLRPGVYGPAIDARQIGNQTLLQLPELSWMSINLHGTRAAVEVREAVKAPEVVDETQLGDIKATASGIITHMEVENGQARFTEGQTVVEGEVLIAGNVQFDPPEYSGLATTYTQVRAIGRVYARTWRTLTAEIPLESTVKSYTGQEETRYCLLFLDRLINIYPNSGISFEKYDKIKETWPLSLGEEWQIPIALSRVTARDYTLTTAGLNPEAAQTMLEEQLEQQLLNQLGDDGEVESIAYTATRRDGMLLVTLTAECREQIGKFSPWESKTEG